MIKIVKMITWIVVGLTIYSFIGGMTYNIHERFYPGHTEVSGGSPFPGSEFMAIFWPIGVPIWGAIELASVVSGAGDAAADELIDE